jgi:hypothetical protein
MPAPPLANANIPAWRELNTPQKLRAGLILIWAVDALLLLTAILGVQMHRDAMKTIGVDTAPSIISAENIKTAMADMDASLANELLGKPGQMTADVDTYEKQRRKAATHLIEAAKNITYGKDEQEPIEALQVGLGSFEGKAQRARDLHERNDPGYVNAYRDAAAVIDQELLPKADQLDGVNLSHLEDTYKGHAGASATSGFLLMMMGAALVFVLIGVQRFLTQKMHRILNPLLVLATLLAVGFVLYTLSVMSNEREDLRVARKDAFVSIHALLKARAVAYAAHADESRYLLDRAHAEDHESAFTGKVKALLDPPASQGKPGSKGFLADELNNITFKGEGEAAEEAITRFESFLTADAQMRRLAQIGKYGDAIDVCTGNPAFEQFDKAVGKTLDINDEAFRNAVDAGFSALSNYEWKASIAAVVIAILAFAGLLPRIREYS